MGARTYKGNSLLMNLKDYTMIDIETTGLDPEYDSIIEVGAIQFRDRIEARRFSSLVNPNYSIDEFITELTGITNDMLQSAPVIADVFPTFIDFIGDDVLVGHNVNFDVNFIYDNCEHLSRPPFSNDFIDTMRLSRRLFPEWQQYRLIDISEKLSIPTSGHHRAIADCEITNACYIKMVSFAEENNIDISQLSKYHHVSASEIKSSTEEFIDEDNPLFGQLCVFTGALDKMHRKAAMQIVVDIGGYCADTVTNKTKYLILGNVDYRKTVDGGKSTKHKKAESMMLSGHEIEILSENVFYDMLPRSYLKKRR